LSPSFTDLGAPADLLTALSRSGITTPFPIQIATIPDLMAGRDVCGKAPTGSGKTLAFGIPLVARVGQGQPGQPRALVLSPTRELALQIRTTLEPLGHVRKRKVLAIYGGMSYDPQRRALKRGVDIVVACPGRLMDLINQRALRLDGIEIVVIDEADRMADMGFLPDVRTLLDMMPATRQTVLFSATLDGDIDVLVKRYQKQPVRHDVTAPEDEATPARHVFWRAERHERVALTTEVVSGVGSTIVFCRTKHGVDRLTEQLEQTGVRAAAIHGGRSQRQREQALDSFRRGRVDALIATDVAARGVHVDGVECVVHFDPPDDTKAYVHRSGRTARAGLTGVVISFVGRDKARSTRRLQEELDLPIGLVRPDVDDLRGPDAPPRRQRPARSEPAVSSGEPGRSGQPVPSGRPSRQLVAAAQRSGERRPLQDGRDAHAAPAGQRHRPATRTGARPR
jgi:superfamily II DNA/RNA helicase